MDFQPPVAEPLPDTPLALVENATAGVGDIWERFQKLTAEIFEKGLIANKTEEELIQMTAHLVLMILAERAFNMTPDVMNPYFAIKERIIAEKKKNEPQTPTAAIVENPKMTLKTKTLNWLLRRKVA